MFDAKNLICSDETAARTNLRRSVGLMASTVRTAAASMASRSWAAQTGISGKRLTYKGAV